MQFCKYSQAAENKISFVAYSQRFIPPQTDYTNQTKPERSLEKWPNKQRYSFTPIKGCS